VLLLLICLFDLFIQFKINRLNNYTEIVLDAVMQGQFEKEIRITRRHFIIPGD